MLHPYNKTLGIINIGENLTIEQTSCDEVSLSNEVIDADSSSVSITFDGSNLPPSVYKGNAEIVQTSTGVNFAMESSTWNLIFQPAGSKASNSCALVRVK
ncbi:MAG: hypothetical protein V4654_00040 [Bdellovibrionota bacterium]